MRVYAYHRTMCVSLLFAATALAAPPAAINIHGQLLSSSGAPVTGARVYSVQFHDASTAGNALGGALTGSVDVSAEGLFNLSVEPPAAILTAAEVWYSLGVDTDDPADSSAADDIFPSRIRVYSVPFALQAGEVEATGVGNGTVDNTEFEALDGVTSNVQAQLDAIDTSGIATNAADIAQLETDVAAKANSADVYTKTESDSTFVAVAGDTMSGTLGVDTISEATLNAGVTADGVTLKDSYVGLAPITAPGDTTGKLYNVAGSLFFNGAAVGGTTFNKDAINNSGTLGFDWLDAELDNALTIAGGTVNNDSFSALSDLGAESAIGSAMGQVAAGDHGHTLSALSGSVTDAQVPDALSISGGTVNNNSFSALSDLGAESAIGSSTGQVAAGDHDHTLSALSGSVTDAQVPDTITISGVDAADDAVGTPSIAYSSDPNTGIHRPGADVLALVTGGAIRLSVDTSEVNLLNSIVEIASGSAPGVTTNKLYNSSGNLFWNGTQLDAAGGGSAAEVLSTFCVSGSLTELVVGTVFYGINEKHSDAVTRHVQFINDPAQRVVTDIEVFVNEYQDYTGARTVELTAVIRDIATGTIAHTVSTSAFNAVAATNFSWHTLPISAVLADRTIEPTEFLAVTVFLNGADGGAGEMDLSFRATLE